MGALNPHGSSPWCQAWWAPLNMGTHLLWLPPTLQLSLALHCMDLKFIPPTSHVFIQGNTVSLEESWVDICGTFWGSAAGGGACHSWCGVLVQLGPSESLIPGWIYRMQPPRYRIFVSQIHGLSSFSDFEVVLWLYESCLVNTASLPGSKVVTGIRVSGKKENVTLHSFGNFIFICACYCKVGSLPKFS